jgi:steroid delta-isomerase-like uncharacterized protein
MAELEAMKAQAALEEQNKEFVKKFFEELDKQNFDYLRDATTDDFILHISVSPEPIDINTTLQMIPMFYTAFPDYAHRIDDILAKGDKVIARMTYTGTHKEEFQGIPPSGNKIEYGGIQIGRIKEGKIAEVWVQEDTLTRMMQLGMELKLKEEK